MTTYKQIGYAPELLEKLKSLSRDKFPDEDIYRDVPYLDYELEEIRLEYEDYLMDALLVGYFPVDDPEMPSRLLGEILDCLKDEDLKGILQFSALDELIFDSSGQYLAIIRT